MKWFEIVKTRGFGAAKIPEFNLLEYIPQTVSNLGFGKSQSLNQSEV